MMLYIVFYLSLFIPSFQSNGNSVRASSPNSQLGLQKNAIPSLVVLGTAKGGTTDIWHLIHKYHSGFSQFILGENDRIQTKKELDFFTSSSMCFNCSPAQLRFLFRCPNHIISTPPYDSSLLKRCASWLHANKVDAPMYTITASPSLFYEYQKASLVLGNILYKTSTYPLFLVLLRNPVDRARSLYNHWMIQEKSNGYALPLEQLLELELSLLETPEAVKYLQIISDSHSSSLLAISRAFDNLRDYMTVALDHESQAIGGRLNLRAFGLLLDGLYIGQLAGWISNPNIDICGHVMIAKSEYVMANRNHFIYDTLMTFFHPHQNYPHVHTNESLSSMIPFQNKKSSKDYLPSSHLSVAIRNNLTSFYSRYSIEKVLWNLQLSKCAHIVPSMKSSGEIWW